MVQRYFWLAYVLLVTLVAVLGASMATSYISARLSTPITREAAPGSNTPTRPTPTAPVDYAVIAKRNIFNANPPGETPPPAPAPPPVVRPEIEKTELQLQLVGTVIGADNRQYAIIEDLRQQGAQALYQVGDAIQTALIAEIRPNCVVLDEGGRYESLCFPEQGAEEGQAPAPSPAPSPSASGQGADDGGDVVRLDNATWRVSREALEQFTNLGALSSQARVMPYVVQGEPRGFRLTRLQQDSVLQKIGLRNGDVLHKVNGLSLTSPDDALRAYQLLQQEGTVRLEILRGNRPTTLTYEIR
jgi:general secretion pathway protein C